MAGEGDGQAEEVLGGHNTHLAHGEAEGRAEMWEELGMDSSLELDLGLGLNWFWF